MTFGVHLGIDFHEILDFVIICENHPNAYIQNIWVGSAHSKPHIFRPKFNQKFILFLMSHSGPHFSTFWRVLMPKCSILGPPWRPAVTKSTPKIAKVVPKMASENSRGNYYLPTCFHNPFRSAPGQHFRRILMNFDGFGYHFSIHFFGGHFWELIVHFFYANVVASRKEKNPFSRLNCCIIPKLKDSPQYSICKKKLAPEAPRHILFLSYITC